MFLNRSVRYTLYLFSSVQWLSHVQLFATPQTAARQASLSITKSWSLLKFMSIESVMPSNHLILCHPLLLLPSILSRIKVFSNESVLRIRWPKYWSFSLSISPSNEYWGLISFRIEWFDLLAVQGTFNNLPQHHSLKALFHISGFFMEISGKKETMKSKTKCDGLQIAKNTKGNWGMLWFLPCSEMVLSWVLLFRAPSG